tara:strand:- start:10492 stop:11091 length:600 start_codon:yes stop_codon:yes gene_type:complete
MSEETGLKPINPMSSYAKNRDSYKFIDGEWWYYYPKDGTSIESGNHIRERASTLRKRIDSNMYINGKYVPKSHPLYKAGRYKSFDDAAFSSLKNYKANLTGQVYIITNSHFKDWVKIGMAVDANDRLKTYQTASPHRDFVLVHSYDFQDRRKAETDAHEELKKYFNWRSEWFNCSAIEAKKILDNLFIKDIHEQLELTI